VDGHDLARDSRPIKRSAVIVFCDRDDSRLDVRRGWFHRLRKKIEHTGQGPASHADFRGLPVVRECRESELVPPGLQAEVVADCGDVCGERTARIGPLLESCDESREVVARRPREVGSSPVVDVDAVNRRKHRLAARGVHVLVLRHTSSDDRRRVEMELR